MLTIRKAQIEAFRASREAACRTRLERSLRRSFPQDVARLDGEQLRALVKLGMDRCRGYGYPLERDIYLYITLMFMLGCYFDEDPQLPWARELLGRGAGVAGVHSEALGYLDRVAGPDNEHLIEALIRIRRMELADFPDVEAADFEAAAVRVLRTMYPAKFAAQGAASSGEVVAMAKAMAERYSMPGSGAAVLAGYAFMLGTGFDRDLVHPWIQQALGEPGGDAKVPLLHRLAVEFAEISLR